MKTITQMIIMVSLFLISLTDISFSQSDDNQVAESKSSFQIGFINETALYYYVLLSSKLELKSGISVFWNYDEKKDGEGYNQSQYGLLPLIKQNLIKQKMKANEINNSYEIALSSQLMYSLNDFEYAKVYLGCGLALSYALTKYSNKSNNYTDTSYSKNSNESYSKTLGIGPSFSVLVKSKLYGSVYLMSEYNLTAYYTWNTDDYNSRNESKYSGSSTAELYYNKNHIEYNGWKMRFSKVRVGLLIVL